jgi:hypothetical protein
MAVLCKDDSDHLGDQKSDYKYEKIYTYLYTYQYKYVYICVPDICTSRTDQL